MNRFALWKTLIFAPLFAALLVACPNDKITGIEATATPASVSSGGTSSLNATVTGTGSFNANVNWSIVVGGGSLSSNTGGSITYTAPTVSVQTPVQIKAASMGDSSFTKTLTVTVSPLAATDKPVISSFAATPSSLPTSSSVLLVWNVAGATSLSIDQGVGVVTGQTSKTVAVTTTTTFTLTATNANGSSTQTLEVTVASAPVAPTVVSVSPANGEIGVRSDAKIVVTFSKPMDQAVTQAAYQSASLPASGVTFDWDASGTVLTIKPNAPLVYAAGTDPKAVVATAYAFSITSTAKDKSGIALVPVNSSFKTLREITATLESEAVRDGNVESNGSFDVTSLFIDAGDLTDNSGTRSFLSFDLSGVPSSLTSTSLERATLNIFKRGVSFDPYIDLHYPCNPACLTTRVILDHVAYGESLDGADFNTPALSSGFIDGLSVPVGYITADMLTAVRDDINNRITRTNRSQYRLSFPLLSDGDGNPDFVYYGARDGDPQYRPSLVLKYQIP